MPASKAQRAATSARRTQAINLRLAGVDYETIAARLGYASRGAAYTDIDRALAANKAEEDGAKENLREVESLRLDRLQAAVWSAATKGDTRSVDSALKIIAQRCKLLGLDAAVRIDATFETSQEDPELTRLLTEARERLAAEEAELRGDTPPST
jgi:hypothetical protein